MVNLDITDDALLKLNALACAVNGVWAFAAPQSYHETIMGKNVPLTDTTKDRWFALSNASLAAQACAVAGGTGVGAEEVKKNSLRAFGVAFGAAAAYNAYNIHQHKQRGDAIGIGNVAVLATLALLNLWKGSAGGDYL